MSLLDRYGIKEVADVTFYELDGGKPGAPVLYLDTLKISTVEQTAEAAEVKGGKGNTSLMAWDYGKEITLNLEDALFSTQSLETMYGGKAVTTTKPMVKNKYLIPDETIPFFKKSENVWHFNDAQAENLRVAIEQLNAHEVHGEESTHFGNGTGYVDDNGESWASSFSEYVLSNKIPMEINEEDIEYSVNVKLVFADGQKVDETVSGVLYKDEYEQIWVLRGVPDVKLPKGNRVNSNEELINCDSAMLTIKYSYHQDVVEVISFTEAGKKIRAKMSLVYNDTKYPLVGKDIVNITALKDSHDKNTDTEIYLSGAYLFEFVCSEAGGTQIDISANSFPGTYYITADTYARNEKTGKDEFFQLIIPRVKVLSETNTITMEADGEPTVFSMSLKALKPKNGPMMILNQYDSQKGIVTYDNSYELATELTFFVDTEIPAERKVAFEKLRAYDIDDNEPEYDVLNVEYSITPNATWGIQITATLSEAADYIDVHFVHN